MKIEEEGVGCGLVRVPSSADDCVDCILRKDKARARLSRLSRADAICMLGGPSPKS